MTARVVAFDARVGAPDKTALYRLWRAEIDAIRIRGLVSDSNCERVAQALAASGDVTQHHDVPGLRVFGLSHFQAARSTEDARAYRTMAGEMAASLRRLASPEFSPLDAVMAYMAQWWPEGCRILRLPSEGILAPCTARIYPGGVGIEAHQDSIGVESPTDPVARALVMQFSANLFLSVSSAGGAIELFGEDEGYAAGRYHLDDGPRVVARALLGRPDVVIPSRGDLIVFASQRVHAVTPTHGTVPRVTLSFFLGVDSDGGAIAIWA
jgi:hypothetical protein